MFAADDEQSKINNKSSTVEIQCFKNALSIPFKGISYVDFLPDIT